MDHKTHLQKLLAAGDIKRTIREVLEATERNGQDDLYNTFISISGRYNRNERSNLQHLITREQYQLELARLEQSLSHYIHEKYRPDGSYTFEPLVAEEVGPTPEATSPTVFLSYSHQDKATAEKIRDYLTQEAGLQVIIDDLALQPSAQIETFIAESIQKSDATLTLVSPQSLLSVWVAKEMMTTLTAGQVGAKQFFAVFEDPAFFRRSFVDDTLDQVEDEIDDLRQTITKRMARGRAIVDLQHELRRYEDLQHNLPEIVGRLKEYFSIDISADKFTAGMQKIVAALR